MSSVPEWEVVVVRAWRDDGGFKVRMLRTDSLGRRDAVVVVSSVDASQLLLKWLSAVEAPEPTLP